MNDFKFEYRVKDEVETLGAIWTVDNVLNSYIVIRHGEHHIGSTANQLKPINKTRERYDFEYLAWQQNNIKVGDWVERTHDAAFTHRGSKWCVGHKFKVCSFAHGCAIDDDDAGHVIHQLRPCDPPKPVDIVGEIFVITGGKLFRKINGDEIPLITGDNMATNLGALALDADDHREIADLLDRYQASVAP